MKKILYLLILISILSSSALAQTNVFNTTSGTVYTDMAYLRATFVNQDPSPADPGAYVNLLFKIENRGTKSAENATLELIPEYPFSLDPGVSAVTNLGTINGLQSGENAFLVKYKLKVDENAVNGDNEIKLKYYAGDGSVYKIATYNVSVSNPRTDFDVIAQDSTTLAIANIGANTAYSVVVKIPKQENFVVSGASASIIGNLDAGDYTLTTFEISSTDTANVSSMRGMPTETTNTSMNRERNLTVEISYTDLLGIRRTVQKEVSFGFASGSATSISTIQANQSSTSIIGNSGLTYIAIGIVGIVVVVAFLKIRKRKKK